MDLTSLLVFLAIGAVAGWLAGNIMRGGGFGLLINIVIGVVGAVIGGWVFGLLGISVNGLIGSLVTAVAGAVLLLFVMGLIKNTS
ncbi:MAG: GlsB/YeaQ/YmgE family stress response membrane protein [Candidatus Thiodiazotropha sp. (ex Monitilora ramsayi)]|nr:GlsB/YeaQ/YmgE family stress response membrane protein [Candidatus Thiodiazotropha sp. (ex Monitilora ramsayi)]